MATRRIKAFLTNRVKNKKNNQFTNKSKKVTNLKVNFSGKNNSVLIEKGTIIDKIKIKIKGKNNCIHFEAGEIASTKISIVGSNNRIYFEDNYDIELSTIEITSSNSLIHIGKNCSIAQYSEFTITNSGDIIIGNNCMFNRRARFYCDSLNKKDIKLQVGDDCMFSTDITIHTSDHHAIYQNNKRINHDKSTIIGNKVWLGMNCFITKGVNIASGSVVGACSLVTKDLDKNNCIYVGSPAKMIKENIRWKR